MTITALLAAILATTLSFVPYTDTYNASYKAPGASQTIEIIEAVVNPEFDEMIALKSKEYGVDKKTVMAIISCESSFRSNAVNKNRNGTIDYSYWQINSIHRINANKIGLDIENPKDNLEFGFILLSREGTGPWKYSKKCWQKKIKG